METGKFAHVLDILYSDTMSVYGLINVLNSDGTSNNEISEDPKYTSKCRISYRKIDKPYENDEKGEPIQFETKIICPPNAEIKAGDFVKVERKDGDALLANVEGYAGYPAKYGTHQEVILIHKGRA